jgi:hypothetical protein
MLLEFAHRSPLLGSRVKQARVSRRVVPPIGKPPRASGTSCARRTLRIRSAARAHLGVRSAGVLRGQEVMADGYTESEQAARFDLHPGHASGQPASQILDAVSVGAA